MTTASHKYDANKVEFSTQDVNAAINHARALRAAYFGKLLRGMASGVKHAVVKTMQKTSQALCALAVRAPHAGHRA